MSSPDNIHKPFCAAIFFRSLVANLAAANHYKKEHLLENWSIVENAELIYISVRTELYRFIDCCQIAKYINLSGCYWTCVAIHVLMLSTIIPSESFAGRINFSLLLYSIVMYTLFYENPNFHCLSQNRDVQACKCHTNTVYIFCFRGSFLLFLQSQSCWLQNMQQKRKK